MWFWYPISTETDRRGIFRKTFQHPISIATHRNTIRDSGILSPEKLIKEYSARHSNTLSQQRSIKPLNKRRSSLSIDRVCVCLKKYGTWLLGPNRTSNPFYTPKKTQSSKIRALSLQINSKKKESKWTSIQHWARRGREIFGSLFREFRSKLSRLTDRHNFDSDTLSQRRNVD